MASSFQLTHLLAGARVLDGGDDPDDEDFPVGAGQQAGRRMLGAIVPLLALLIVDQPGGAQMSPTPSGSVSTVGRRPGSPWSLCSAAGMGFFVRMMATPLWVPLKGEHFDAFAAGTKTTEYRRLGGPLGQLKRLSVGRAVTLSRGYSGPRLHMVIKAVSVVPAATVPEAAELYGARAQLVAIELEPALRRVL
jgi:hypothetical protein